MFVNLVRLICAFSVGYLIFLLVNPPPIACPSYEFGMAYMRLLQEQLIKYQQDTGSFPKTLEVMKCVKTANRACVNYNAADPWGHEWIYMYPAKYGNLEFDLYSKGADGKDDFGKNDDISNWNGINYWVYNKKLMIEQIIIIIALCSPLICLLLFLLNKKRSAASTA